MRTALLMALAMSVSACTTWPDAGQGGVAELPIAAPPLQAVASLAQRHLDCSLRHFDMLRAAAERDGHGTGRIDLLQAEAVRAQREVAGDLADDADHTLTGFDSDLAAIGPDFQIATPDLRQCPT